MDRLTDFLQRFDLRATLLHKGALLRPLQAEASEGPGRLYLLRRGAVELTGPDRRASVVNEPTLIFYARPQRHVVRPLGPGRPELLGVVFEFGAGDENPLLQGLDMPLRLPLASITVMNPLLDVLFEEASSRRCGQDAVLERLFEALVVRVLRLALAHRLMDRGVMAGLSDPRLVRALKAVHAAPQSGWTLERMAARAGMSRSRFAEHFTTVMGLPAAEYLKRWRVGLAKRFLREGRPVKQVALEVGYGSSASFGRAFGQIEGATPTAWLRGLRETA